MKITGITRGNAFVIWLLTHNGRHLSGAPGFHRRRQVRVVTQVEKWLLLMMIGRTISIWGRRWKRDPRKFDLLF
jgi:hypothetical protein